MENSNHPEEVFQNTRLFSLKSLLYLVTGALVIVFLRTLLTKDAHGNNVKTDHILAAHLKEWTIFLNATRDLKLSAEDELEIVSNVTASSISQHELSDSAKRLMEAVKQFENSTKELGKSTESELQFKSFFSFLKIFEL